MDNIADLQRLVEDYPTYAKLLLKIRTKEPKIRPFALNEPQQKYHKFKQDLRKLGVPVRIIILKNRQSGFTTYEQGESYHWSATRENQAIITMAHVKETATEIFQMVQLFHQEMHPRFKPEKLRDSGSKLIFPKRRCTFSISAAGQEKIGITLNKIHLSEFAYYPDPSYTFNLVKEAVPPTGEIVIESTPNGFNQFEEFYTGAQDLYNPRGKDEVKNAFYRFFTRWFDDSQYQDPKTRRWDDLEKATGKITIDEKLLIDSHNLTPMQLAWRRWKVLEFGNDLEQFWEKYPEDDIQCFISSGKTYFNLKKFLNRMITWANKFKPVVTDETFGLKIWEHPQPDLKYSAGADPAQGIDEDGSAFHMLEQATGRTVMTFCSKTMSPHEFARKCHSFCKAYNDAFLVVERNNHGHTVLNELLNHLDYHDPSKLYYHQSYFEDFKPVGHQIAKELNFGYEPGFPTKSNTKALLLDGLKEFAEENPESCLDIDTIGEIKTFKRLKGGKLGAEEGKNDDRVIAFALAQLGRLSDPDNDTYVRGFRTY